MKFVNFLNELSSEYGMGITFIDIDETIFKTFAKISVVKNGKIIKSLSNQEFNTYELGDGESYDFGEFRSAKLFAKTSIPIHKTIDRIKRIFKNINVRGSRVILLTARSDFDDKETFLQTFRRYGIPIDSIYVERAGNMETGTIAERKQNIIMKYLSTGLYRRIRLIDDDIKNLKEFLKIERIVPNKIIDKIKSKYNITDDDELPVMEFYALKIKEDGSINRVV